MHLCRDENEEVVRLSAHIIGRLAEHGLFLHQTGRNLLRSNQDMLSLSLSTLPWIVYSPFMIGIQPVILMMCLFGLHLRPMVFIVQI